ncbi:polysaccharide pyruvyl transferase family protein, partial [Pleurocapsales cyanobacterium LEGE 10410]|nr:polysaccharide pyruvyl transferase family protein [Pleurocapsales cyanobacterium LEGE 10410]
MKVGILTYHHTTNYGATLQAYALWKTIKQYGHEVEIIDYRPYKAAIHYLGRLSPVKPVNNNYLKYRWANNFILYLIQAWKMRKFVVSEINLSQKKTYTRAGLKNFSDKYDVVICGSDQIWSIKDGFRGGFNPSFFLDFVDDSKTRKISYAPSFGQTRDLKKNKQVISQLVSEFDRISVRDDNSLNIIEKDCNRVATTDLDPTFMNDFSEFESSLKLAQG